MLEYKVHGEVNWFLKYSMRENVNTRVTTEMP